MIAREPAVSRAPRVLPESLLVALAVRCYAVTRPDAVAARGLLLATAILVRTQSLAVALGTIVGLAVLRLLPLDG